MTSESPMPETISEKVAGILSILDAKGLAVTWFRTGKARHMLALAMAGAWKARSDRPVTIVVVPREPDMTTWTGAEVPVTTMLEALNGAEAGGMIAGHELDRIGLLVIDDAIRIRAEKILTLRKALPSVRILAMADQGELPPVAPPFPAFAD